MLYTFQARDGSTVEREYSMHDAPKVGTRIRVKGKTYRRVLDFGRSAVMVEPDRSHTAYAFTKAQAQKYCMKFDKHGHGMLSGNEIANVEARMQSDGIPFKYDRGIYGGKRGTKI